MTSPEILQVVVLSGLSGSGKTAALHALEDAGFYCVDNLPTPLVPQFLALAEENPGTRRVALVLDVRERLFTGDIAPVLANLDGPRRRGSVLYLECDDVALTNRFKTTRRPHPLVARGQAATLEEAFALEREWLLPFREHAQLTIDTTSVTVHDLRRQVRAHFEGAEPAKMALQLRSFGYHHGLPPEADYVFDVRFLENPYFVASLRDQTGLDEPVVRFVIDQPAATRMRQHILALLDDVLPQIEVEGRAALTVAIGCTGGRHRSVAMVEALKGDLEARGRAPIVSHRDLAR
ncbi:MAG: RNase adapter RapZ [Myxococcota bacterium]